VHGRGKKRGVPFPYQPCQSSPGVISANVKTDRGCIGSSGNVGKGRLAKEWLIYVKSLQLSMWGSSWFIPWLPVSNKSNNNKCMTTIGFPTVLYFTVLYFNQLSFIFIEPIKDAKCPLFLRYWLNTWNLKFKNWYYPFLNIFSFQYWYITIQDFTTFYQS
jgi:hypothetical protein